MAGEWVVRLGGSSGLVLSKATKQGRELVFSPNYERVTNEKGETEGYRATFEIEGNVVSTSESDVADKFVDLTDEISTQAERQFEALLDGSAKWDIDPSDCFWGPYALNVRAVPDEGGGSSHWRYTMTVAALVKGTSPTYDADTELTTIKNPQGKVVKKMWRATVKAKNLSAALSQVSAFKPSGGDIAEEIREYSKRSEAVGIWTWIYKRKAKNSQKVISWECDVSEIPAGEDYIVDKQAGLKTPPVLHEIRADLAIVEVRGMMIGLDPKMKAPKPHFTQSSKKIRVKRRETGNMRTPKILSEEDGTYFLRYHEYWLIEGKVPKAKHSDEHDIILSVSPPGDGSMGT